MSKAKTGPKPPEYYLNKCIKVDECLLWTGAMSGFGYAVANINGRGSFTYLHEYICEHNLGYKKPTGHKVDHICNRRNCLNPDHLRYLSHADNISRSSCGRPRLPNSIRSLRGDYDE